MKSLVVAINSFVCVLMSVTGIGARADAVPPAPDLAFERLSVEHGLSHPVGYAILQDRQGFLWFGTEDGLNRYDGYPFKGPKPNPDKVQGSNNDGVWNTPGAAVNIRILAAWWQTGWFFGVLLALLVSVMVGGYRWRVSVLKQHRRELETQVTERTAALRASENRLRTIFETSQAGIILVDPHGVITFANQRMADLFKCTLPDLLGSAYSDHIHPEQQQIGDHKMRQLIAGEITSVALERHYRCADGSDFWGLLSGRRLEDEQGQVVSLVGIIADITERKQAADALRVSEERFRRFFAQMPEYAYMLSPTGVILDINAAALQTLGYARDELIGQPVSVIYSPASLCKMRQLFARWQETKRLSSEEIEIITRQGEKRTVLLNAEAVCDDAGNLLHSVSVQTDITERKHAEAALQDAKDAAEAAERVKSTFLTNVSHHLRTPLNAILGFSELMAEDATLAPIYHEYLALIRQSGNDLLTLINQMLRIAKLPPGELVTDESSRQLFRMLESHTPLNQVSPAAYEVEALRRTMHLVPAELRAAFVTATQQFDIVLMMGLIEQIRPFAPALADQLAVLTRNFEYEIILNLLHRT